MVEKLTKNVNEDHLREIFGAYGPIRDVELPMNRQCQSPIPFSTLLILLPFSSLRALETNLL